ncbi:MAG: VWA domain-containing protein [Bacteroidetes bacterium]|nr:MAG: VWA domain-containing protein [Bacteroidota bacterium]
MNNLLKLGIILLLSTGGVWAQLRFEKTEHDFGDLDADSERLVDIEVTNIGKKREYFLSFRKEEPLSCLSNGQRIDPDSTLFIRIQVNPVKKGPFEYRVQIFTSDREEATVIRVRGNVKELPEDKLAALQKCPDFNQRPAKARLSSEQELLVIDAQTQKALDAKVFLVQQGIELDPEWVKSQKKKVNIPIGMTQFYAVSEGYEPADTAVFIALTSKLIVIRMHQKELPVLTEKQELTEPQKVPEKEVIEAKNVEEAILAEERKKILAEGPLEELDSADFTLKNFKPVNVVFVADVSGSMRTGDKANLMKYALNQLIDMLREEDRMGIVSFATNSKLLLSADEKLSRSESKERISGLRTGGSTAGVEGIKKGLEELDKQFLPQGTNMLVIVTDGAFELTRQGERLIERAKEKGVEISIVGIKTGPTTAEKLQSKVNDGFFVLIRNLGDAQRKLKALVRKSSYRGR